MLLHKLTVEIYEASVGDEYPVVVHIFYGKTKKEAASYFKAHMSTDSFLRDCELSGCFKTVECRTESQWDMVNI